MENLKKVIAWAGNRNHPRWKEAARELQPLTGEKLVEDPPFIPKWNDDDTILTNKGIFDLTEIMLHPRKHNTYDRTEWQGIFEVSYYDRERLGVVVKDEQAWRFIPLDGIRYGSKSLVDIGRTVFLLNRRDKIKEHAKS